MSFQENLRYYREKAGYTTKTFSDLLNLPYATYAGYEYKNREPKYKLLIKIADLLNVSIDELLGRENNILGNKEDEQLEKIISELIEPIKDKIKLISINETTINFVLLSVKSIKSIVCPVKRKEFVKLLNQKNIEYEQKKKKSIQDDLIEKLNCFTYAQVDKDLNRIHKQIRNLSKEEQTKYLDEIYNRLAVLHDELSPPSWEKDDLKFFTIDHKTYIFQKEDK